jgi:hypothetical protein
MPSIREADRCRCARPPEAVRVSSQRSARARGRRAGARRRARATADQRRRARRHDRGAAACGLAAVDDGERAHHATYSRRDLPLRGRCARDHAGESRTALARRDRPICRRWQRRRTSSAYRVM